MFPDLFLPTAALAACGVATALFCLRSGMVLRGMLLLVALAIAADVALVARFVYLDRGTWFGLSLWALQLASAASAAWLCAALVRRRWSADARRREELFAAGFQHYLRDELPAARGLFRRLLRANPWDVAAMVALANVAWRQGRTGRARSLLRRARRLDRRRAYAAFIGEQLRRLDTPAVEVPRGGEVVGSPGGLR